MSFNRFDHSVLGEIRPRFQLKIDLEPERALTQLQTKLKLDPTVSGTRSNKYMFLRIPARNQHYWSPELSVRIEQEEFTDFVAVICLVGPKQSVWMLFTFFYAFVFCVSTFGGIYGLVKFSSFNDASWLWVIPLGLVLTLSIFFTSKIGQNKGRDQMLHLISFLYHSLNEVTKVERINV